MASVMSISLAHMLQWFNAAEGKKTNTRIHKYADRHHVDMTHFYNAKLLKCMINGWCTFTH